MYFYRDKDKKEIDLIIEENNTLYPIEIKKHADLSAYDIRNFAVLDRIAKMKRGPGGVICFYDKVVMLKGEDRVIPVGFL